MSRALERVRKPCGVHMRALQHCIGLRESRQAVDQAVQALANLRKLRAAHLRRAGAEITISQTHMDGEQLLDALCQIARPFGLALFELRDLFGAVSAPDRLVCPANPQIRHHGDHEFQRDGTYEQRDRLQRRAGIERRVLLDVGMMRAQRKISHHQRRVESGDGEDRPARQQGRRDQHRDGERVVVWQLAHGQSKRAGDRRPHNDQENQRDQDRASRVYQATAVQHGAEGQADRKEGKRDEGLRVSGH